MMLRLQVASIGILRTWLFQNNAERNGGNYENGSEKENIVSCDITDFVIGNSHDHYYIDADKKCINQ